MILLLIYRNNFKKSRGTRQKNVSARMRKDPAPGAHFLESSSRVETKQRAASSLESLKDMCVLEIAVSINLPASTFSVAILTLNLPPLNGLCLTVKIPFE